jgi:hypothetical protein
LDIGGGQLVAWGLTPLSAALTGASATLRQLRLGIAYMDIKDPEFVDFCETGLASLTSLETLSLDVSHNWLTSVGVDAIHTAVCRTLRCATFNLSWNYNVQRVCLRRIEHVHTLDLDVANTCVNTVYVPDSVSKLSMDMRRVQHDAVFIPLIVHINQDRLRHLTLHVDASTVCTLRDLSVATTRLTLMLDLSDREPIDAALRCIVDCNDRRILRMLHLRYAGVTLRESQLFVSTLRTCNALVWLRLEMYAIMSDGFIHSVLCAIAGNLGCLLGFEFTLGDSNATLCADTLSPCIHFASQDGTLRNLVLDFTGTRLTDTAVTLLGCVAVLRRQHNPDHTTTFRMQGSSVGVQGTRTLASAIAIPGCVFYFHPPMSTDVDNIRRLCSTI